MNTAVLRRAGGVLLRQKALPSLLQRAACHQQPVLALALQRTATAATRRNFSQTVEKVPEEDYYDGHLMADHLEYLDDMMEKTLKVETVMSELKETYEQKRQALSSSTTTPAEIEGTRHFHCIFFSPQLKQISYGYYVFSFSISIVCQGG
jgi:hypothetical protein